jgi:hypothetical protein
LAPERMPWAMGLDQDQLLLKLLVDMIDLQLDLYIDMHLYK